MGSYVAILYHPIYHVMGTTSLSSGYLRTADNNVVVRSHPVATHHPVGVAIHPIYPLGRGIWRVCSYAGVLHLEHPLGS